MSTIVAQICIRRDTAANFTSANPTLALGEIAYETDTRNIKVGDGATAWTALGYINPYRGGTAAADTSNTVIGSGAGVALTGSSLDNTLLGFGAGANVTGIRQVSIGYQAGSATGASSEHVNIGWQAGQNAASGNRSVHAGFRAGWNNGGSGNVAIGGRASQATCSNVVAVGNDAALLNTASNITAVGANALDANTTGTNNTAVGKDALGANTTGSNNIAVGGACLDANTTGQYNVAVGYDALSDCVSGTTNTAIGQGALGACTASSSTGFGTNAGLLVTTGNSVFVGMNAGLFFGSGSGSSDYLTSADESILIGRNVRPAANSQVNQIVIGNSAIGNGSNTTTIGNSSTTGTFIPAGNLTLTNGNFIVGTSGKGIDFSATANSSGTMTSELLSDYEEGTFTPDIQFGGGSVSMTYTTREANYTKVGRQVTIRGFIELSNKGTSTGAATLSNLPFTAIGFATGSVDIGNVTFADRVALTVTNATTNAAFNETTNAGARTGLTDADFTNTSLIIFTLTYFT